MSTKLALELNIGGPASSWPFVECTCLWHTGALDHESRYQGTAGQDPSRTIVPRSSVSVLNYVNFNLQLENSFHNEKLPIKEWVLKINLSLPLKDMCLTDKLKEINISCNNVCGFSTIFLSNNSNSVSFFSLFKVRTKWPQSDF